MERTFSIVVSLFVVTALGFGQGLKGAREISLSAQFGEMSTKEEYHSDYDQYSESDDWKYQFLTTTLRFGVFVTPGLAIAPELNWTAIEELEPAYSLAANLEYNFVPKSPSEKWRAMPFLLAGYGLGNSVPAYFMYFNRQSDKFDVPVLNLGAGLKLFASERAAFRVEYRYQRFTYDRDFTSGSADYTTQFHRFMFGIALFCPRTASGLSSGEGQCCVGCGMAM